jgi:hypothetical protein
MTRSLRVILLLVVPFRFADHEPAVERQAGEADGKALAVIVRPGSADLSPEGFLALTLDMEDLVRASFAFGRRWGFSRWLPGSPIAADRRSMSARSMSAATARPVKGFATGTPKKLSTSW